MDWLNNNPLTGMYGPHFLLLYGGFIVAVMIGCRFAVNRSDSTREGRIPPIPQNPDPYEIAYLRGGPNELARLVMFDLVRMGYAEISEKGIRRCEPHPPATALIELQRAVFKKITTHKIPANLFKTENLREVVSHFCQDYELHLRRERLIAEPDARSKALIVWGIGAALIVGLCIYKLSASLADDHYNVFFMLTMAAVSTLILYFVCRPRRLSARGRKYLERLQAAFASLPTRAKVQGSRAALAADPTTLLLVGVFGIPALAGTPFDSYHRTFTQSTPSGGGSCGGGCGSGGCGGGGCGGGGCGGGGCGGCGGA